MMVMIVEAWHYVEGKECKKLWLLMVIGMKAQVREVNRT